MLARQGRVWDQQDGEYGNGVMLQMQCGLEHRRDGEWIARSSTLPFRPKRPSFVEQTWESRDELVCRAISQGNSTLLEEILKTQLVLQA